MNPTFTIESVHGVKQTFVLGPTESVDRSGDRGPSQSDKDRSDCRRDQSEGNQHPR